MKKEEKTLIIEPFEGCNFQTEYQLKPKKRNTLKPFPHNMQLDNTKLLQEENYHLFNGDAAIFLKDAEYIRFDHLLYDLPFFKMGTKLKIIGYKIMLCNPHLTQEQLYNCLYHIFVEFCQIPKTKNLIQHVKKLGNNESLIEGNIKFTEENIERIKKAAGQIMSKPYKGNIKKQSKVIFNPDYELTEQEKRDLANKVQGKEKSNNRIEEIHFTIVNWDSEEKPTQKNVAKKLGVSERTVRTYWKDAKEKLALTI
ncbi:helix-turn-helix transcriptional regulator [Salegentibacter sediminis]|uniref:helix-turn-helix transcriptional regulator n=1 Tax=Salegentibacter sediminis TaxID=1930251 RepID=UPI0009BE0EFB|nr:hypothetical protein [Salegentibacter sediminis]